MIKQIPSYKYFLQEQVMALCFIIFICLDLSKPARVSAVVCASNEVCKARFVFYYNAMVYMHTLYSIIPVLGRESSAYGRVIVQPFCRPLPSR